LIASCTAIQEQLGQLTESNQKRKNPLAVKDARVMGLLVHIRNLVQSVEQMTSRAGGGLDLLSPQSQRAYQWLRYLSESQNLDSHLAALHMAHAQIETFKQQPNFRPKRPDLPVRFQLYNLPVIYRVSQHKDRLLIEAHQGFVGAPPAVIQAMLRIALGAKVKLSCPESRIMPTARLF
jgi:hypothetical protein